MKKRVVVVDDNIDIRYTIAEICKLEQWTVLAFENHREISAFLKEGRADLFLVDYHLPEKDGIEIVRMIRAVNSDVPIILLTVEEREKVVKAALGAGADDYALKPIKAMDLISRIKVHLKHYEKKRLYTNTAKGINQDTLEEIYQILESQDAFMDIDEVAEKTQITDKSVYRYLKYMKDEGMIESRPIYGEKAGRPKTKYRILKDHM